MDVFSAKVLYAKQVARKRKTWQDGFLLVSEDQSKRSATLYDESGVVVSRVRVPSAQILNAESEGTYVLEYGVSLNFVMVDQSLRAADVSVFEGWIVTVDSVCHASDLPSTSKGSTEGNTMAPYTIIDHKPAHCFARWQPDGQVAKFHAPRATGTLMLLNCSNAPASAGSRHALRHPTPDPTPQQNSLEPSKKAHTAERVGPVHAAAKRSGAPVPTGSMPAFM